jgi:hypothetical protein
MIIIQGFNKIKIKIDIKIHLIYYKQNNMSRDIASIIPDIISLIPEKECLLLKKIKIFINDLGYKPPELRTTKYCWAPFVQILNEYIPDINEEWQKEIAKIINDVK